MDVKYLFQRLFMVLAIALNTIHGNLSAYELSQLIKSVSRCLNLNTIILLTHSLDELNDQIILEKYLSYPLEYYTGVWDFKRFTRGMYSDVVINPPKALMVVEFNSENLRQLGLISKRTNIAEYDWLVLPGLSWNVMDIVIPFNCRFIVSTMENNSVVLDEVYRISKREELMRRNFGRWDAETGLKDTKGEFFNNRKNLRGHEFRYAVHNLTDGIDPCKSMQADNGKQMFQCANFQVWNDLASILNFTTNYVPLEDCYTNGTVGISTPMLEMIRSGGADSGNDGYIWSSSRLAHSNFFVPLFHAKVIMVTKIPSRKFSLSSYVHPFSTNMWLALIGWLLLSGVIINIIKHTTKKFFWRKKISIRNEYIDNAFLPFAAICYQSSYSIPKEAAVRFACLMVYLIPVVFIPSYSGSIISSLSVPPDHIPFNDLKEFEENGGYKLSAVNSTYFHLFLMTDEKFEVLRRKKLVSTEFAISYEQSFREICSKKITFIYDWPLLTKYSINCNIYKLDLFWQRIFSSMAVQKKFPYLELFNRQFQKLITAGLSMKIVEKASLELVKAQVNPFPKNYFQLKPFGFEDVLPLFTVLFGGMSLSVFLLLVERQLAKSRKNLNL